MKFLSGCTLDAVELDQESATPNTGSYIFARLLADLRIIRNVAVLGKKVTDLLMYLSSEVVSNIPRYLRKKGCA